MANSQEGCVIDASDPRLEGQQVDYLLTNMKCRLVISGGASRSSIIETAVEAQVETEKPKVNAALAVTQNMMLLDLKRQGRDDAPKEYLRINYTDALFQELGLEYGNSKKTGHLIFVLPNAGRFFKATELDIPQNATVKVTMDTYKAPDVAMHVQRILHRGLDVNCAIQDSDPRLGGQEAVFLLNTMKCRLQSCASAGARSSMIGTVDAPAERTIFAALAVTGDKLIMDMKRAGVEESPQEYLCISFDDPLLREIGLEYSNDALTSRLCIVLPNAQRFFKASPGNLNVAEDSTVKVFMETWKAPDIVMYLKHQRNIRGSTTVGTCCEITQEDPRLGGEIIVFSVNSMKCRLQICEAGQSTRSSILGSADRNAVKEVSAALCVTETKMLLDLKRAGTDDPAKEYLCITYKEEMCSEIGLECSNDARDSHLVVVLPNANQFFKQSHGDIEVPDGATIRVYLDSWKAPDIAMYVRQKVRKART